MFASIDDFLREWQPEAEGTQKVLDNLTDASLSQQVTADHRTLGRLAWHLTTTFDEMVAGHTGLQFEAAKFGESVPETAKEIADAYRRTNESMIGAIRQQWTDETLTEERDMYGEMWTIETVLKVLFTHQIHHRGQMTVLMRQAGLKVPGLYGPSKEEWADFGGQAPEI